ncbi:MAG: aminotransferase class III-fold pyridoxal phosphate-dependent enzyme, partial [Verrucomicrobiales bacterium]
MSDLGYSTDAGQLGQWDREFLWHPFTYLREWLAPDFEVPLIVKGEGCYLFDAAGRRLIDGNASIWCNLHGHGHLRILDAVKTQLDQFAHSSFLGFSHPPGIVLARRLIGDYLGKWGFSRVFYSESGSNAIEAGLRMALQWQILAGNPERRRFAAFRRSYHGDSLGANSVTGLGAFNAYRGDSGYAVTWLQDDAELDGIPNAGEIAALIVEPVIAGAAGMVPWPDGMLARCRDWCDRHGVLFLHDEVFTGFGRTGKMFAFEHESCPADILILGKGLSGGVGPLSATVVTDKVFQPFARAGTIEENFLYGHSYAGHAVACAGGIASLDVFAEERVLE